LSEPTDDPARSILVEANVSLEFEFENPFPYHGIGVWWSRHQRSRTRECDQTGE
jgi:hypothetical protein